MQCSSVGSSLNRSWARVSLGLGVWGLGEDKRLERPNERVSQISLSQGCRARRKQGKQEKESWRSRQEWESEKRWEPRQGKEYLTVVQVERVVKGEAVAEVSGRAAPGED